MAAELDRPVYMKLPVECGDLAGKVKKQTLQGYIWTEDARATSEVQAHESRHHALVRDVPFLSDVRQVISMMCREDFVVSTFSLVIGLTAVRTQLFSKGN